jgi:hypothetical protein
LKVSLCDDRLTVTKNTSEYHTLLEKWFDMVRALLWERMLSSS